MLAFRLYDGCPLSCSHCAVESKGELRRNSISKQNVRAFLSYFLRFSDDKIIFMSGNDIPLGDIELISILSEFALDLRVKIAILSSGYWFKSCTQEKWLNYFKRCCISHIQLSYDSYHSVISHTELEHLICICRNNKITISINETLMPFQDPSVTLKTITERLRLRHFTFTRSKVGKAKNDINVKSNNIPYNDCDFGDFFYLQSNGNVYGCSGPGCIFSTPIGNVVNSTVNFDQLLYNNILKCKNASLSTTANEEYDICQICTSSI